MKAKKPEPDPEPQHFFIRRPWEPRAFCVRLPHPADAAPIFEALEKMEREARPGLDIRAALQKKPTRIDATMSPREAVAWWEAHPEGEPLAGSKQGSLGAPSDPPVPNQSKRRRRAALPRQAHDVRRDGPAS